MHCWVPKTRKESKPNLLLIHGFGANALWQWGDVIRLMVPHFNVYVPDLLFFGDSYTTQPDRSESFQARCVMRVMEANRVGKVSLVGLSYGGFVAYSLAAQFRGEVERVVICCAGVCLEEKDLGEGMFRVSDLEEVGRILLPQTAEKMRELMSYTFVKPPKIVPSCLLQDFIDVMFTENVEEKRELIRALAKDRKLSDLPKIPQPTLIIWGEEDQVFPLELGYRLKRHLGENAQLVVIKNTGHAFIVEKPKELFKHLKSFLIDSFCPTVSPLPNQQNQALTH
jgi:pimeloyl-ACP methyl ester carboxylesterase